MAISLGNRAKMSTSTTGTGTITLGSAVSGYQTFANAGITNGQTVRYAIEDGSNFEIGSGTYTASGTTLTRSVTESSNSDNAISLSGSADVYITATVADLFINDGASALTTTGLITSGTLDVNGASQFDGAVSVGVDDTGYDVKFFGDTASAYMLWDTSADDLKLVGAAGLTVAGDIDVDGTTNLDVVDIDGAVNMATTALVTGVLTTTATQVATGGITSGSNIVSDTDSTDDLGTTSVRWANLFVDAITATDQITATGFTGTLDGILGSGTAAAATATTLDTSGAVNLNLVTDSTSSTSGALIVDGGVGIAKKLFVGTDLDVDGTTNLDAVDIDGAVQLDATLTVGANDQGYDVILYGDTASANVTWDTSADDLIFNGAAGLIVPAGQLTIASTAMTSSAAELNTLDALSRGSIIYGNASAATAVLTKGTANQVLTSDGTDISWAAVSSGVSYITSYNGDSDYSSPNSTYTSSGTWSKGGLADDALVVFYLIGGGGGGGNASGDTRAYPGMGGCAALVYGTAKIFDGAAYVVGAGGSGSSSGGPGGNTAGPASTLTLTVANLSQVFTTGTTAESLSGHKFAIDADADATAQDNQICTITAPYWNNGNAVLNYSFTDKALSTFDPEPSGRFFATQSDVGQGANERDGRSCLLGGGGGAAYRSNATSGSTTGAAGASTFAGNGGSGAVGAVPGGGGSAIASGTGYAGGAGSVLVFHI